MNNHKNRKFRRFGLNDTFKADGKTYTAYSTLRNGMIVRNFEKLNKKRRREYGI